MLYANESTRRHLLATASLYRTLQKRSPPVFLPRNLDRVLDDHAETLRGRDPSASESGPNGLQQNGGTSASPSSSRAWNYGVEQIMLDMLAKRRNSVLKVDIRGLRIEDSNPPTENGQAGLDGRASKRQRLPKVQCDIEISVFAKDPTSPEGKNHVNIYKQQRRATMEPRQREAGVLVFDIDMGGPQYIDVESLYMAKQVGASWKRDVSASNYSLQFNFHLASGEDAALLMPYLSRSESTLPTAQTGAFIKTNWSKLPLCPPAGSRLPAKPGWPEKTGQSPSLDINISWQHAETILETNNKQLPTPESSSVSSQSVSKDLEVSYELNHSIPPNRLRYPGAACFLCDEKDYGTLDKLAWHLKNYHDLFQFDISKTEHGAGTPVKASITVNVNDRRAQNLSGDAFNKSWVAPRRPFDLEKYVNGDKSWVKPMVERKRGPTRNASQMNTMEKIPIRASNHRRAEDIQEFPHMKREKYKVPPPPKNVSFFRTISKRVLYEGELVSESDDDIEDTWLKVKQNRGVSSASTPSAQAQTAEVIFVQALNDYFQEEQLSGDLSAGDAFVRFAKRRSHLFKSKHVRAAFRKKAKELRDDKIISQAVYERSLEELRNRPRDSKKGHRKFQDQLSSINRQSSRPAELLARFAREHADALQTNRDHRVSFLKKAESFKKEGLIDEATFRDYLKRLRKGKSPPHSTPKPRTSGLGGLGDSEIERLANRLEVVRSTMRGNQDTDRELAIFLLNLQDESDPDESFQRLVRKPAPSSAPQQRIQQLNWALDKFLARLGQGDPNCTREAFNTHVSNISR
jgi:hypothetical protein